MTATPEPAPLAPREVLRVLLRRKLLLIVPWGTAIVLGIAAIFLLPPVFSSSTKMMI